MSTSTVSSAFGPAPSIAVSIDVAISAATAVPSDVELVGCSSDRADRSTDRWASIGRFLCCTDNMPSGTAMALGDVITIRDGTTLEVINTDAEGRLVMADGLALAVEEGPDAIVDIATLTGACMRALGTGMAGVMGSDQGLVDQVLRRPAAPAVAVVTP